MARQPDVQYIRCYVDGSAARKLESVAPVWKEKTIRMPVKRAQKRKLVYVDPVAILGTLVAICMLVTMLFGVVRLKQARQEAAFMQQQVVDLSREHDRLQKDYTDGYDLQDIEQKALALGMVPADQAQVTTIRVAAPEQEPAPASVWEQIGTFLTRIFA